MADKAFELKGSLFTLTILQLQSFDVALFKQQLNETIEKAPNFFQNAPIVFDLNRLQNIQCPIDFSALAAACRAKHLHPMGVIGGNADQQAQASKAGLGVLPSQYASRDQTEKASDHPTEAKPSTTPAVEPDTTAAANTSGNKTKVIKQPVRSGQQIYAKDADLIVLGSVSHGAELVADGNIHIYGALRGRALAGVGGDTSARIFCRKLDAELISIAGLYQLNDNFAEKNQHDFLQIFLENDKIQINPL